MEKPGIEPATPGLQGIALIPYIFFVAFLDINQFHRVGLRFVLVFITGTPKGSPEVVFKEKSGIEPATPGLQGIALIPYTTRLRSQLFKIMFFYNTHVVYIS